MAGTGRAIAEMAAAVVGIQFLVCALQAMGTHLFALPTRAASMMGDRVNGTLDHPGDLGKMLVLLTILVLPLTEARYGATRWLSIGVVPVALAAIVLTGSRTNIIAYLLLVLAWILVAPSASTRLRVGLVAACGVAGALAVPVLVSRFQEYPEGGQRLHLLQVAIEGIPQHLWVGVGPNSYVTAFGKTDSLTAEGWSVHNVLALALAEAGRHRRRCPVRAVRPPPPGGWSAMASRWTDRCPCASDARGRPGAAPDRHDRVGTDERTLDPLALPRGRFLRSAHPRGGGRDPLLHPRGSRRGTSRGAAAPQDARDDAGA